MFKSSVGARAFSAGLFCVCSCLALGCEEGHAGHYAYRQGPGHAEPWPGVIRFEWSPGSTDEAISDDDAGATLSPSDDGAPTADAGVQASASALRAACDAIGAQQFQALLFSQGEIVAAFQAPCSAGSAMWRVRSNDYSATAALVTDAGVPVTETKAIPSFVVAPGETQVIRLPFVKPVAPPN